MALWLALGLIRVVATSSGGNQQQKCRQSPYELTILIIILELIETEVSLVKPIYLVALILLAGPAWGQSNDMQQFIQETAPEIQALGRAQNLARMAGENANGGIDVYRAESAMFGAAADAPYTEYPDAWLFRFQGGAPGATVYTIESEVRVDKVTFDTAVVYNGPLRSGMSSSDAMNSNNAMNHGSMSSHNNSMQQPNLSLNNNNSGPDVMVMPLLPMGSSSTTTTSSTTTSSSSARATIDQILALGRAKNLARQAGERENGGLEVYRVENAMHGVASDAPYSDVGDAWIFRFRGGSPGSSLDAIETEVRVDQATFATSVIYNGAPR